jgi:two-component system sensor histidine kinase PilS (NtrC family)
MAHEIRNPLAALRGATELLGQFSPGSIDQKKLLGIIIREADRLNTLLGSFLLTVNPGLKGYVPVMLDTVVEQTVELFSKDPVLSSRVTFETFVDRGVVVDGDPQRLKQALWHVLSNAAEASAEGGVIRVRVRSDKANGQAFISVQDFGVGLAPEIKDRIFEPLTSNKEGRAGMGLAIVMGIVEGHDGNIEADSSPTNGTVFTIRLPLAARDSRSEKKTNGNG